MLTWIGFSSCSVAAGDMITQVRAAARARDNGTCSHHQSTNQLWPGPGTSPSQPLLLDQGFSPALGRRACVRAASVSGRALVLHFTFATKTSARRAEHSADWADTAHLAPRPAPRIDITMIYISTLISAVDICANYLHSTQSVYTLTNKIDNCQTSSCLC